MTAISRAVLLANGELRDPEYARAQLRVADTFIAANGGSRLAFALDIVPDLLIGDSDSLPSPVSAWLKSHHVPTMSHPAEKDETDLELALHHAISLAPREILFLGITGGRTDHVLANFSLLAYAAASGIHTEAIVEREHIYAITDEIEFSGSTGDTVSLLPWGGDAHGVTTAGLKWALEQATLPFGTARGVSNLIVRSPVRVSLSQGLLLVVHLRGGVT